MVSSNDVPWRQPLAEIELRDWVKHAWGAGVDDVQPGRGSSMGLADLSINVDGVVVPVELKIGHYDPERKLVVSRKIRPAQIRWHHLHNHKHGGTSMFLIGVGFTGLFSIWVVPGSDVRALAAKGSAIHCRVFAGASYKKGKVEVSELFRAELKKVYGWVATKPEKALDLRFHFRQKP